MLNVEDLRIRLKIPHASSAPDNGSSHDEWYLWARPYLKRIRVRGATYYRATGLLDRILKLLAYEISRVYEPPSPVIGYVRGKSTLDAAVRHIGQKDALALDLKSFFRQITVDKISTALSKYFSSEAAAMITGISTVDGTVPMGLRTSPVLSNLSFEQTDLSLLNYADTQGLNYTRWADDLVFSGSQIDDSVYESIEKILQNHSWVVNPRKTRFMRNQRMILGLNVHAGLDRPHVPRTLKRNIKLHLYLFDKFEKDYLDRSDSWDLEVLGGRIEYVKSIDPVLGESYQYTLDEIMKRTFPGTRAKNLGEILEEYGV